MAKDNLSTNPSVRRSNTRQEEKGPRIQAEARCNRIVSP